MKILMLTKNTVNGEEICGFFQNKEELNEYLKYTDDLKNNRYPIIANPVNLENFNDPYEIDTENDYGVLSDSKPCIIYIYRNHDTYTHGLPSINFMTIIKCNRMYTSINDWNEVATVCLWTKKYLKNCEVNLWDEVVEIKETLTKCNLWIPSNKFNLIDYYNK